jgi:outer membrane murein-binding lipoprotein Lpp
MTIANYRARLAKLPPSSSDYHTMNQKVERMEHELTQAQFDAQALRQADKQVWEEERARLEIKLDRLMADLNEPVAKPAE